jgi:uncharacterized protein YbjT (DUF2867 family)
VTTALVAGATGHVGSRLVGALWERGVEVRAISRSGGEGVTAGDVADRGSMLELLADVDAAYYVVHSLGVAGEFGEDERNAATTFAAAARDRGVARLVYLGGIVHGDELSPHLASRREVGEILRGSGIPTVEFRTSIVVGAGSASFELVRDLVDALPVLVGPDWLDNPAQPIGVDDVVAYLFQAPEVAASAGREVQIGGPDVLSYGDMLDAMADALGKRRRPRLPVPLLTPSLSSLWIGLVTPVDAGVARPLVEGLATETVVTDPSGARLFDVHPQPFAETLEQALREEEAAEPAAPA